MDKEKDKSGIIPTGGHVLVLPDAVEEKTSGGIYLPETIRDKEQAAATSGIVVSIGSSAWKDLDDGSPWAKVGDRVSYSRYAGVVMKGNDSIDYVFVSYHIWFKLRSDPIIKTSEGSEDSACQIPLTKTSEVSENPTCQTPFAKTSEVSLYSTFIIQNFHSFCNLQVF